MEHLCHAGHRGKPSSSENGGSVARLPGTTSESGTSQEYAAWSAMWHASDTGLPSMKSQEAPEGGPAGPPDLSPEVASGLSPGVENNDDDSTTSKATKKLRKITANSVREASKPRRRKTSSATASAHLRKAA